MWQLRFFADSFKRRKRIELKNCAENWKLMQPPKRYPKGYLKWVYYDYYMSILNEFLDDDLITEDSILGLERDEAFSFFVLFMIDTEYPHLNIKYDSNEELCKELLEIYKNKPYYESLVRYYNEQRKEIEKTTDITLTPG